MIMNQVGVILFLRLPENKRCVLFSPLRIAFWQHTQLESYSPLTEDHFRPALPCDKSLQELSLGLEDRK